MTQKDKNVSISATRIELAQSLLRIPVTVSRIDWLSDMDDPLSKRIAREVRFGNSWSLDKEFAGRIKAGLAPPSTKDWGTMVSWVVQNFPKKPKETVDKMDKRHNQVLIKFAMWQYANCLDGANADEKISVGMLLSQFSDTEKFGDVEHDNPAYERFVNDVGPDRATELLELNPKGYESIGFKVPVKGFDGKLHTVKERNALRLVLGGDYELMPKEGLAAARAQGWHENDKSYVIHQVLQTNLLVFQTAQLSGLGLARYIGESK